MTTTTGMLPYHVCWRLRARGALMTGIRYGANAEAVRMSLLAALRETSDTAAVLYVRLLDYAERSNL